MRLLDCLSEAQARALMDLHITEKQSPNMFEYWITPADKFAFSGGNISIGTLRVLKRYHLISSRRTLQACLPPSWHIQLTPIARAIMREMDRLYGQFEELPF